jgi:hypothetical protein
MMNQFSKTNHFKQPILVDVDGTLVVRHDDWIFSKTYDGVPQAPDLSMVVE